MVGADQCRDQVAADDEEHVDADEAAAERGKPDMEEHDRQDGHGPEAVDLGTVGHAGQDGGGCRVVGHGR